MSRVKVLFIASALLLCTLLGGIAVLYFEYKRLSDYRMVAAELSHNIIAIRDTMTQHALGTQSDPYYLTQVLVNIERESQGMVDQYTQRDHLGLYQLETYTVLVDFSESLTRVTDALDHVIGVLILRESLLTSLSQQLSSDSPNQDLVLRSVITNNLALLEQHLNNQELRVTLDTFREVETQKQHLFTTLLLRENIDFIERTDDALTLLITNTRNIIIQMLGALIFITSTLVLVTYILRVKELNRNNAAYQEAIDKTERANQAKSIFLATMSHELRTPMNGVLGIAEIVLESTKEQATRDNAKMIINSGQHLVTLLNDILDFSKVEQGKMVLERRLFEMKEITLPLQQSLLPLAMNKEIDLIVEDQTPVNAEFMGDVGRIRQILFNLTGNAIKFTSEGKVEVTIALHSANEQTVIMTVTDTGIGIAREKLDEIFTPFEQAELSTTRNYGGTGLGLSIVKRMTDLMKGEISVFSQLGIGSKFTLTLPLPHTQSEHTPPIEVPECEEVEVLASSTNPIAPDHKANTTETDSDNASQSSREAADSGIEMEILLVEDNPVNAVVAQRFLNSCGHHAMIAKDGLEALEILKSTHFNLVIIDNHMPNLGGVETIKRIRNELKLNTVIFGYTADVFKEAHDEFIDAGANFVLTKPLQKASLEKVLEQFHTNIFSHSSPVPSEAVNVIPLVRYPIDKLPMTEEEISKSSLLCEMALSEDEKVELLITLESEINDKTELLFHAFAASDTQELHKVLHAIKGTALEFNMVQMVNLAEAVEEKARNGQLPEVEELQKLVNRMLINGHQAARVIEKLNKQRETG
ncbi:ATP-binding protein [Thaumasiovibrio subtropicus]|uniref:ATP-binding protein n=1 Tax=Thaumasiovibrio subtropicus TaxID=1891207 RepID=UPI000B358664|nr:ATP-binding protein [Thaumasiovibrio subtropicus]